MTQLRTQAVRTPIAVGELSAGDVVLLEGGDHPAVVEAISDVAGPVRSLGLTYLRFGTSTGRLSLPVDAVIDQLDVPLWWHSYTNVSDTPVLAWVRGERVSVDPGRTVAVVDVDERQEFAEPHWQHVRLTVRTDRLRIPGWQTLRAGPAA